MAKVTILFGLLLIALGLVGYFGYAPSDEGADAAAVVEAVEGAVQGEAAEDGSGGAAVTALIPAFVGGVLLLLGLIALSEGARKHAMHGAAMIGLLGFLAGAGRGSMGISKFLNDDPSLNQRSFLFVWLMALLCGVFLILCIRSFRAARKAMQAGA